MTRKKKTEEVVEDVEAAAKAAAEAQAQAEEEAAAKAAAEAQAQAEEEAAKAAAEAQAEKATSYKLKKPVVYDGKLCKVGGSIELSAAQAKFYKADGFI